MFYFLLKGFNLFFVFLLMQIYSSAGYKKFIRTDLRTYLVMANNYKAEIMAYFYNNKKLEQVITTQQKKVKMYKDVGELKNEVQRWKRAQNNLLEYFGKMFGHEAVNNPNDMEVGSKKPLMEEESKEESGMDTLLKKGVKERVDVVRKATIVSSKEEHEEKLLKAKHTLLEELKDKFSMQKLRLLNEEDPNYERKKKSYKKIKSGLPLFARWYLAIHKKYVNQALFIENINDATKIKSEASKGICRTNCDLKSIMKKEINLVIEQEIANELKKE